MKNTIAETEVHSVPSNASTSGDNSEQSELSPVSSTAKQWPVKCVVCDGWAHRMHYGVAACNACAAFFRRTINHRRTYFCAKNNCILRSYSPLKPSSPCKSCRFNKCVEVGMVVDAVWDCHPISETDQFANCPLLRRMLRARQAVYVNKINRITKLARKYNIPVEMGMLKPSLAQSELSKESEFEVLMIYLEELGFDDLLGKDARLQIAFNAYYRWLFLAAVAVTLANGGHRENVCYFSDRGHMPIKYDDCYDFWRRLGLGNVPVMAGAWLDLLRSGMRLAQRFHRLDRVEFAAISQLATLQSARELYPDNELIGERIAELFAQIQRYCWQNYSDFAVRLGEMVLLLDGMNELQNEMLFFAALVHLSGREPILRKMMRIHGGAESVEIPS